MRRPLISIVLLAALGAAALQYWEPAGPDPLDPARWADGRPALLIGRVAGHPSGTRTGDRFAVEAEWLKPSGRPAFRVRGRVAAYRRAPETAFSWGDRVTLWGPLSPAGRFSPRGGGASIFIPAGKSWRVRPVSPWSPKRWAGALRDRLRGVYARRLEAGQASLLAGLVIGQRSPALAAAAQDFRRAGTYHLLVASGSNVGLVLVLWWWFARWGLWWPRRWALAAMPFWAFLYAAVVGGEPPVMRAAVMASAVTVGHLLGRWDRPEQPLFLSLGLLLAWDPGGIADPGLQMSYAATFGIATLLPRWETWLKTWSDAPRLWGIPARWVLRLVFMSFAAQLALMPILLQHFGRLSIVGIFGNVVAVPLASAGLGLGVTLGVLDGWAPEFLCRWTAAAAAWTVDALAGWSRLCAQAPWAEWALALDGPRLVVLIAAVAGSFYLLIGPARRWGRLAPLWGAAAAVFLWWPAPPSPELSVLWGAAGRAVVLVETPEGRTLLDFSEGEAERRRLFQHEDELRRATRELRPNISTAAAGALSWRETAWTEGEAQWRIYESSGHGAAALLEWRGQRVLLCARLTAAAAADLARRVGGCDALGWLPRRGDPAAWKAMDPLARRWLVVQGRALTRSFRRGTAKVFSAGKHTVRWTAGPRGARLEVAPGPAEPVRLAPSLSALGTARRPRGG